MIDRLTIFARPDGTATSRRYAHCSSASPALRVESFAVHASAMRFASHVSSPRYCASRRMFSRNAPVDRPDSSFSDRAFFTGLIQSCLQVIRVDCNHDSRGRGSRREA